MYRRILVPLDVTPQTEVIVPHVEALARAFGSLVILLHIEAPTYRPATSSSTVTSPPTPGPPTIVPDQSVSSTVLRFGYDSARIERTRTRIEAIAQRLREENIDCEVVIEMGPDVATRIAKIARDRGVDLIALATRPNTGWERIIFGSISDHVARATSIPLLIVRAANGAR